jgi:predicted ATPase/class 3 adenylate cyclase
VLQAFLFTDIEGSTSRWERFRSAMSDALRAHDDVLRGAVEAHEGRVFKTIGDAFCATFDTVPHAVAAALDAQRRLGAIDFSAVEGLRVRMAIHAGTVESRDDDFFGPTLNRVARLLSIGHGGHVLLSAVAAELARGALPDGATLRDDGLHGLKDLVEPERVFVLEAEGLLHDLPPLRSIPRERTNLPRQTTELVGRTREREEIEAAFADRRVVTIVGPGGVGKTRTAIAFAHARLDDYEDGAWFVDLAPLADGALIDATLGALFGLKEEASDKARATLVRALAHKKTLLVFDNCEHLIGPVAKLASDIVRACPDVAILATSREPLRIEGEATYSLGPLAFPDDDGAIAAERALGFDAVRLFVERARDRDARFTLTDANAPTVSAICRRLDGIALAIELAAARVTVLSVRQIDDRLSTRFRLLASGTRREAPRQQTLRALIDWSYDLLDPAERTVFARLGIFSGSFSLDAAVDVVGDEALDRLSSLVEKSLLTTVWAGDEFRYRLLESIRAYALDRLDESGERDAIARRHAETFCDFADDLRLRYKSGDELQLFARARWELDNVRAALEWSVMAGHAPELGARTISGLRTVWVATRQTEGRRWALAAHARLDLTAHPELAADLSIMLADLLPPGPASAEWARAALDIFRSRGNAELTADAIRALARSLIVLGQLDEAELLLTEALALDASSPWPKALANDRVRLASVRISRGDLAGAREYLLQAIDAFERCGAAVGLVSAYGNLGMIASAEGALDDAIAYTQLALDLILQTGNIESASIAHINLAQFFLAQDRYADVGPHLVEALKVLRDVDRPHLLAAALTDCALFAVLAHGDYDSATTLSGFCDMRWDVLGIPRALTEDRERNRLSALLLSSANSERAQTLRARGARFSNDEALAYALTTIRRENSDIAV